MLFVQVGSVFTALLVDFSVNLTEISMLESDCALHEFLLVLWFLVCRDRELLLG